MLSSMPDSVAAANGQLVPRIGDQPVGRVVLDTPPEQTYRMPAEELVGRVAISQVRREVQVFVGLIVEHK